jgi:hypothetical protein
MEETGPSLLSRIVAVVILAVGAWLLLKVVIGAVIAVAWTAAGVLAIVGIIWAFMVLRR